MKFIVWICTCSKSIGKNEGESYQNNNEILPMTIYSHHFDPDTFCLRGFIYCSHIHNNLK